MPPKKQPTRLPPRRSGRHTTVMDDDEELLPQAEEGPAVSHNSTNAHKLSASAHGDNPDSDTIMQDHPKDTENPTFDPPPPSTTSPRSSTSTAPAATVAPVQRLTSVLHPSSSPTSSRSRLQPPSSDPSHHQQQQHPPALKFKPKAVVIRRSKEEREAAEKVERERLAARFHGATGADSSGSRGGRGRGGRGVREGGRGRGRGRGGSEGGSYGYGFGSGGGGNRGDAAGSSMRRGTEDAVRVASGPLGGATVDGGTKKSGRRWGGSGIEEEVSGEEGGGGGGGDDEDEDVVEMGGGRRKGKRKGKGGVKEEAEVKPEGGDKDEDGEGGKKGKRKAKGTAAGGGAGGGKGKGRAKVKKEDDAPTYISSEGEFDSDTAEKINIEAINLVSSEDEEDVELSIMSAVARGKQKERDISHAVETRKVKNWMNRPVHVERLEHVERTVGVNTDASSLTSAELRRRAKERKGSEGGLFVDEAGPEISSVARKARRKPRDVEFVRDERKWKGVYNDEDDEGTENDGGVRIKTEPTEEPTPIDMQPVLEKDDEVPGAEAMEVDPMDVDKAVQETAAAVTARNELEGAKTLDEEANIPRKVPIDEEDVSDEEMGLEVSTDDEDLDDLDLEMTEDEQEEDQSYNFSNCQPEWRTLLDQYTKHKKTEPAIATDTEAPPKSTFSGNSEETRAARYHKTSLIQLPPLMPSLRDALTKTTMSKRDKKAKSEPTPVSTDPFTVDTTKEETPPPSTNHQHIPNAIHQPAHASDFALGTAGTLTFYSSGRTLASWGDLSFEVTKEREALGLAQETMIMDYEKVVTKVEDQARWEDVITVGGKEGGVGGKVGYSGGTVEGGLCVLGA